MCIFTHFSEFRIFRIQNLHSTNICVLFGNFQRLQLLFCADVTESDPSVACAYPQSPCGDPARARARPANRCTSSTADLYGVKVYAILSQTNEKTIHARGRTTTIMCWSFHNNSQKQQSGAGDITVSGGTAFQSILSMSRYP